MKEYKKILKRLEDKSFSSYLVGGFVRDRLMDRENKDIDIATKARPSEIMEVFKDKKLIDIGKKFGTIKVISNHEEFEITTFRAESNYKDKRHPGKILFSDNIYDDLKRRDFTINAMALRNSKLIDPYGGKADIDKKIIRAVGDPFERIREDFLRSLRAVRFAVRLDFKIEPDLKMAIKKESENIKFISKERISDELSKILVLDRPSRGIRLLNDLGLLEKILPEISAMVGFDQKSSHHDLFLFDHTMKVLDNTPKKIKIRMAALFHDTGKISTMFIDENGEGRFFGHQKKSEEIANKRLKVLKFPKKFIKDVSLLTARHMDNTNTYTKKSVRKLLRRLGDYNIYDLFFLQRADTLATKNPNTENIDLGLRLLEEIKKDKIPKKKKDLAIDGNDIIKLGFKEGRIIGKILDEIFNLIEGEELQNKKSQLIKYIKNNYIEVD